VKFDDYLELNKGSASIVVRKRFAGRMAAEILEHGLQNLSFSEGANFIGTRPKNNFMVITERCLTP